MFLSGLCPQCPAPSSVTRTVTHVPGISFDVWCNTSHQMSWELEACVTPHVHAGSARPEVVARRLLRTHDNGAAAHALQRSCSGTTADVLHGHAHSIAEIFSGCRPTCRDCDAQGFLSFFMPSSHLSSITLEVLSSLFVYSEKEAAKILGICLTTLKKASRKHGIDRWPYRKIKSGQLRESRSLKRSSSNTVSKPLQNSMSPPNGSSDYDSESSSQFSSNTAKLARSSFTSEQQAPAGAMIFSNQAIPTSMYSFEEGDAGHSDSAMWMNTVEESSWKKVPQQRQNQYPIQEQFNQRHEEPQHGHHSSHFVNGHFFFQSGDYGPAVHDMEYSDVPVLYSRPIEAMPYSF